MEIVVCGYPKSGTTWICRLTAELVQCPVAGFWFEPENHEDAMEGADRESPHKCYKAHHLGWSFTPSDEQKIVHVLRDPRDVAVSGAHYFKNLGGDLAFRIDQMVTALALGRKATTHGKGLSWCEPTWAEHAASFDRVDAVTVRYEDALANPHVEAKRIVQHLGLARTDQQIQDAVDAQSFEVKKAKLKADGRSGSANYLRNGAAGVGQEQLTEAQLELIRRELGDSPAAAPYRL